MLPVPIAHAIDIEKFDMAGNVENEVATMELEAVGITGIKVVGIMGISMAGARKTDIVGVGEISVVDIMKIVVEVGVSGVGGPNRHIEATSRCSSNAACTVRTLRKSGETR